MKIILHKFKNFIFLVLFMFLSIEGHAQFGPNCPTLCYGPGGALTAGSLTITANTFYSSVTIKNGEVLTVKSGFTLYVGQVGTLANSQVVDFQNGSTVVIEAGASLIVNGRLNNSNNSDTVTVTGSISVTGNVTVGNGSIISGTGSLVSTGTVSGPGIILGQTGDCYQASGKPIISSTPPTCSTPGSSQISNYNSSYSYAFTPTGPTLAGGLISGMAIGTSYRVSSSISSCKPLSDAFSNAAMLPTPATPTIASGGSTAICTGGSVTLSSSAATSYLWSTGATTQSITVSSSGSYSVKVKNAEGCESLSSAATVVTVNASPTITTQPLSQLDCEGAFVSFNVTAVGSGLTYIWQYKKITDVGFLSMPVSTNVTYPSIGKITIGNVGGTQFPNGTQFQVIVSNGTCSVISNTVTLSVNEIVAINSPALIPSQSVVDVKLCYGSNYSYQAVISNPSNGLVTYQWKSQIPSGTWNNVLDGPHFSGATTATLNIINGTLAESGKYRVDIVFNRTGGNCSVSSFSTVRSLSFYPLLTIPVETISPPDCITNTGTIAVTVQSATDSYSFDNGLTYQSSNTKSGLAAGTYNIFIKNIGGCISPVKNATIIAPLQAVWNGSWTNGPPTSTQAVVFNASYTIAGDMEACSCQVNSGSVTVSPGVTLKITNGVTVTGGNLTFEDSASLVQINNVSNSGNIRYSRGTQGAISNFDYTYWSSPVSPQTLFNVSPQTLGDKFFSFNGATDSWVQEASSTVMGAGIGYIIRGPQSFMAPSPPSFYQATFIGVPNNGTISIPIGTSGESSYLLGNPYPSALDGETFIKNNSILDGTLYFWTHGTKIGTGTSNLGSGLYAYTSDDYASFNLTGGAAASSGGAIPTGKIGSGQGFFVTTVASGSVNFANTMRVGVGGIIGNNSQFFKTQPSAKTTALEKNRLWLDFFNEEGAFKQALIGYVSGASNDLDMQYDGESFDANEYVDFYSILNNKNLVIQGRAVPFDQEDKVILGFKTTIEGEFTIKIKQFDGLFDTQDVFIEDKLLKIKHDLKKEGYTFTTAKGTFDDRFVLFYANAKGITTTTDLDVVAKLVYVSTTNKDIKIASSTANIEAVKIFDVSGKEVFNKQKINSTDVSIRTLRQGNTVYVVKIKLDNGQTLTQKVIY